MHSITENKEQKYYVLSGNKGFFSRYCDNGFKTKWTGLWKNSNKYLEYYSIKGMKENKCKKTEYNYIKAVHSYNDNSTETLFIPKNKTGLYVKINFLKEKETELKLAVNIRKREENLTQRKYQIKTNKKKNKIKISNDLGKLNFFLIKGKMNFIEEKKEETHFPSNEKQKYFVPGKILLKGKQLIFAVIPEKEKKLTEKDIKKEIQKKEKENKKTEKLIECNNNEIKRLFADSAKGITLLKNNKNFFAGYPWFLQYWGRDNLWSLNALLSLGEFEKAEKILLYFWKKNKNGKIPNYIEGKKVFFNSIDASLLFLIGLSSYVFASGNKKILKKIKYKKVMDFIKTKEKQGLIFHKENETWMDSIKRKGAGIEIQALYLKALHSIRNLLVLKEKEKEVHETEKKAVELNRKIIKNFEKNSVYRDLLNEKNEFIKTCNPLVYLMQKPATKKEIELFESEEFNSKKGILTLSRKEKKFNEGYHTGLSWSLCNGWMACSEFKAERKEKALEYLMKFSEDLNQDCVGGIGECWNSKGELKGCGMQLWGHALAVKAIDEFMLGIKLNAFEKKIFLQPKLPESIKFIKRKIRIGNTLFELIVEKKKGKILAKTTNKKIKTEFY